MSDAWIPDLQGTHFWDCSGGGCDATTLSGESWQTDGSNPLYIYAPQYAPINPADYGGAKYGEQLWMTGAASDTLSDLMGPDDGCCGYDSDYAGGCGKCVLIRNPSAVNWNWTAVVMKKNRCPPWSSGCESGNAHLDLAVPGYDNLGWSTANICGSSSATYISEDQSTVCGSWWTTASNTIDGCDCSTLPSTTDNEKFMKRGCELFSAWGWISGDPSLDYQIVDCPTNFTLLMEGAFNQDGIQQAAFPTNPKPIVEVTSSNSWVQHLSTATGLDDVQHVSTTTEWVGDCDCAWTGEARSNCGTNDNSHCWSVCCDVQNPDVDNNNDKFISVSTPEDAQHVSTTTEWVGDCDCAWAGEARSNCGTNDNSHCWSVCCNVQESLFDLEQNAYPDQALPNVGSPTFSVTFANITIVILALLLKFM